MTSGAHTRLNVRFFLMASQGHHDPIELYDLDMYGVSVVPLVGDLVHEDPRSREPAAYRVVSRHFDPRGRRLGIMVEKIGPVEDNPFTYLGSDPASA